MKKKRNKIYLFGATFICLLIVIFIFLVFFSKKDSAIARNHIYKSSLLKIKLSIPQDFQIKDTYTRVAFTNKNGTIYLDKIGTNYKDIKSYLENLSSRNHLHILREENLSINGYSSIRGVIDNEKFYAFYYNYTVYTIWTESRSLFDDLDQVARSFRYIP